jgi:pSer/pThr/pTyr-binding forkhead associated (FHA) protein
MEAALQGPFGRTVLGPSVLTIGRALDNQLVVNNPTASSHHAEIRPDVYGYRLIDSGSTNGTFVNEQRLDPHMPHLLQTGDRIRIGDMTFMYEAGRPDLQGPLVQESSHEDAPTVKVRASEYRANGLSEQFGNQPPAPYSSYTPQQQAAPPSFTRAFQQSNMQPWATDRANDYSMLVQPLPYTPALVQSSPMQPLPYIPAPVQPKSSNRFKVLLIVLSIVLVLGAGGGGIAAYLLTRPQPVMSVTSNYNVGSTTAGSTGTILHVSARSFSGSSAITFLLDNAPVASGQNVSSDADGNVKADLTITTAWAVGNHTLIAKDASGYTTKVGVPVAIVPQGQAHTPGPNGAPPDDMSFTLKANVQVQDAGTGQQSRSITETLIVTGKPDPSGGTVCQSVDDGQPHNYIGNTGNGITYRETYVWSCSGTYKGGKLTYIETTTSDKVDFSNGLSCQAHTPYVFQHLEGTFTSQNTISGTLTTDSITVDCNQGVGTTQLNARNGSWTAQM